ncbi:MAG: C1 family peptidase [Treponema sp.]|nr:C1 family peptidase [Treponema sp.]
MPRVKKLFLFFLIFSRVSFFAFAQGAILDEQYDNLPRRIQTSLSYEGLPSSFSLKLYAPLPGDQGDYGTCVGWAAAYAAKTIAESAAIGRINQTQTTRNAFSVVHAYKNSAPEDPTGYYGTQIYSTLDFLRDSGAVRMKDIEREVSFSFVDPAAYSASKLYPIGGYYTLFSRNESQKQPLMLRVIKRSLSEGNPVIIAMNTPDSFIDTKDVWEPWENPDYFYYAHAMCVVGYDDNLYGGSFEVLNSWGRKWGNGGYIWIPYDTFIDYVYEAYELIDNIALYSDENKFGGFARLEISGTPENQETRTVNFNLTRNNYYEAAEVISSDSRINFTIGSEVSSYVYSFIVSRPREHENFYSPALLFPHTGLSPLMGADPVNLPGNDKSISLSSGENYIITLYSKQALEIQNIMRVFASASGTLNKRLAAALGDDYTTALNYNENEASFTAAPDNPRAIAALIVAIKN